jgi:hypothetical protein
VGPDRLTWVGTTRFLGGGSGRDPALDWRNLTVATRAFWRLFRALSHPGGYGLSAVSISSRANGAFGEHQRLRLSRQPQAVDSVIGASRGRRTLAHPDRHDRPHG